jgi:hypothetical protein
MKTLWCKNQENPSDRISHAWAPLKVASLNTQNIVILNIRCRRTKGLHNIKVTFPTCLKTQYTLVPVSLHTKWPASSSKFQIPDFKF